MRSKIKICGITQAEDALLAEDLGADFIGLIFTRQSRRAVTVDQARTITARLTHARPIGVFIEQDFDETVAIARAVGLHGVQHYAMLPDKPAPYLYIHAHGVQGLVDDNLLMDKTPDYLLLDHQAAGQAGGTGQQFDWSLIPAQQRHRLFLAGGIGVHNIAPALSYRPYAVDLCSSVEDRPGVKDHGKLKHFFAEVGRAEKF